MAEIAEEREFYPVGVDTIQLNRLPEMDIYIQRGDEPAPLLFQSRTLPLTKEDLKDLLDHEVLTIWLNEKDYEEFDSYVDSNLEEIIHNPNVPVDMKCEITYNASAQIMEKVFHSADPQEVIHASERVLNPVIDVIFENQTASHEFILQSSVDYAQYTHSVNVCLYGMALARRALRISKEEALQRFGPGFLLLDWGKSKIPKEILHKDGELTDEEWEIVKQHPIDSLNMVKEFMDVTPEIETILLHHHERLDGSGYPFGLKGGQISEAARICAIVDTFDAISTTRPFRARKNSFEALMEMKNEVPDKLDGELYQQFLYLFLPPDANLEPA